MAVAAFVLSIISVLVAVVGTVLSNRRANESQRVAEEALDDTRQARLDAVWSAAIEAVGRIYGLDPTRNDMQKPLQDLRVAETALADVLPTWHGVDRWLAAEHARGSSIARHVLENARPGVTIDEHMTVLQPFMDWGMEFSQNLRHVRTIGPAPVEIADLTKHAVAEAVKVHQLNGWPIPSVVDATTSSDPGVGGGSESSG